MMNDSVANLAFYESAFIDRGYEQREDQHAALLQELWGNDIR